MAAGFVKLFDFDFGSDFGPFVVVFELFQVELHADGFQIVVFGVEEENFDRVEGV